MFNWVLNTLLGFSKYEKNVSKSNRPAENKSYFVLI